MEAETEVSPETCSCLQQNQRQTKLDRGELAAHLDPDSVTLYLQHLVFKIYCKVRPTLAHQDKSYDRRVLR